MAERVHLHKGYVRSDTGKERSHLVSVKHKDKDIAKWHNVEVMNFGRNKAKTNVKTDVKSAKEKLQKMFKEATVKLNKTVLVPLDEEGYLFVDLTQDDMKYEGIRIKFERKEGRKRRTVGLQIER